MALQISFVIPIYNRPEELRELLVSLKAQSEKVFEIVVVEDGSQRTSNHVVDDFKSCLPLVYFTKENTGPGDSRNFGMARAKGNYFIILDSDCVLPKDYLKSVHEFLANNSVDFFGGSDTAHPSFNALQKAINFTMTSFLTTGGLRGAEASIQKFEPRSFNMGISRSAFEKSGGFGLIHPGEDPDLTIRLWRLGFDSAYIKEAYVFHKRRINLKLFYKQVHAFGRVRPILMRRYPEYSKWSFWLPSLFLIGVLFAVLMAFVGMSLWLKFLVAYLLTLFLVALFKEGFMVSILVIPAFWIQMMGYGYGFLKTKLQMALSDKDPELLFPSLFFKKKNGS
jgi:glycosyltransferase involved in cell wall biosynthesis